MTSRFRTSRNLGLRKQIGEKGRKGSQLADLLDQAVPGAGSGQPVEQPEPPGLRPAPPSWQSADPTTFFSIRDWMLEQSGLPVGAGDAARALNDYAARFHAREDRFPTSRDIIDDELPWTMLGRVAVRSDLLPARFFVDGPQGRTLYVNTPDRGVLPAEAEAWDYLADIGPPQVIAKQLLGSVAGPQILSRILSGRFTDAPSFSVDEVSTLLRLEGPAGQGGGRGSGGRAALIFDSDELREGIRSIWRSLMIEEPTDLDSLVRRFQTEAQALWREGGRKDLETWVLETMRATPRYQMLYGRKDPSLSEAEWLNRFRGVVQSFGAPADIERRLTVRGASQGPAPAAFAQALRTDRDITALGTGGLSRSFAQLLSQLGPLQRGGSR